MDFEQSEPTDELFHRDPQWIAEQGRFLHGNNVLFYFAQSPFFDRQSNNNSIFLQAISDPRFASWLATRESFEAQLARLAGIEYVVTYDPIASNVRDKSGDLSTVWVIQKQTRKKKPGQEDEVTPTAMYYIVGDAIYQAPSIAKLIGNRMLSTMMCMNKILSSAASLPLFSAANGHTYFPPNQQSQPTQTPLSQQSKENTPTPHGNVTANLHPGKSGPSAIAPDYEDTQLFLDALNLSRRYGNEYMDEAPLVGEPGNFRISRVREAPLRSTEASAKEKEPSPPVKETNVPAAPLLPIQTNVPPVTSKKSAKTAGETSPSSSTREKPKRRKSRPNATPTDT